MTFVARTEELEILNNEYTKQYSSFVAVYGRRRIGKTELVDTFIAQKDCLSFSVTGAYEATLQSHLANFANKLSLSFGGKYAFVNWDEAFLVLQENILTYKNNDNKKLIIFIDELPWLAQMSNNGFKSALSLFWNDFAAKRKDIFLVVCGSATSWIINHVIEDSGSLSNRVTSIIHLNAFTLSETKQFLISLNHKGLSNKTIVDYYMALGGVAHYLKALDPQLSFPQNMEKLFFSKNGLLRTEYNSLFRSLFKTHHTHEVIVQHLSYTWNGYSLSDLSKMKNLQLGKSLSNALTELEESGFIVKRHKYGQTKRDALYSLCDPFIYFFTKWVLDSSLLTILQNSHYFMTLYKSQPYKIWSGFAFENICHLHIGDIKNALGIKNVITSSHYWNHRPVDSTKSGAQIDILLVRNDDVIDIIECKFYNTEFSVDKTYAQNLRNKESSFLAATKYKGSSNIVLISTFGVEKNSHYHDTISSDITIDSFFSQYPINKD